ncbi:MAG: hypothetical protein R3300_19925 [Candidatus Promineifilaceae bacterium]|nr:hypothetical protein [Candidatus Promineifilaceae bacterium]
MILPQRLPGLKWLTTGLGIYGAVWITLEGALGQVLALAMLTSLTGVAYGLQQWWGGRQFGRGSWLLLLGGAGLVTGLATGLLSLGFMALKTGLHAHGPEFDPLEIGLVIEQTPLWTLAGLVAGLGLGLLTWSTD